MSTLGAIVFVLWFVSRILNDEKKKQQRRQGHLPPDFPQEQTGRQSRPIDFEIPPIEGAPEGPMPPFPYETEGSEEEVFSEYGPRDPEMEERVSTESHLPENRQAVLPSSSQGECPAGSRLPLLRNPETAREAVLYAEIFGRPKALRRRNR